MSKKSKFFSKFKKDDIVKYNNKYYVIKKVFETENPAKYEIDELYKASNVNNVKTSGIIVKNKDVDSVYKDKQHKIRKYVNFMRKYNKVIEYIGSQGLLLDTNVDKDMELIKNCKLYEDELHKLITTLKFTKSSQLELYNIIKNPYDFITESFQIISFDHADSICEKYNLNVTFKIKCEKWPYDLIRSYNSFYIPCIEFNTKFTKFCEKNCKNRNEYINIAKKMVLIKEINGKSYHTTNYLLELEKELSDSILDLYDDKTFNISMEDIETQIKNFEEQQAKTKKSGIYQLEPEQKKAVIDAMRNPLNIITGYPGTGKTEIVKCILFVNNNLYRLSNQDDVESDTTNDNSSDDNDSEVNFDDFICDYSDTDDESPHEKKEINKYVIAKDISLLAPTGNAFKNLSTSQVAQHYNKAISGTCCRIIHNVFPKIKACKHNCTCGTTCKNNLQINCIVVDEFSMVDIFQLRDLLKICKYFSSRLIILGDDNQLQSIGPGTVLKSIIDCNNLNTNKLTKIKRQDAGALINNIKKMNTTLLTEKDFTDETMVLLDINDFILMDDETEQTIINQKAIIDLINEKELSKDNTKILTYYGKKGYCTNTTELNNIFQNLFNGNINNKKISNGCNYENDFTFKEKDVIMRTINDYSQKEMHANGEHATIESYDEETEEITISYVGENYKPEKINRYYLYENFVLSYCLTIHKSQGSQYDNIIIFIEPNLSQPKLTGSWDKTALYTAISRAKKRCFIISTFKDFNIIQKNNKKVDDRVSLFLKIFNKYDEI